MGGIMLIAFSSLLPIIVLPHWGVELFVWSIITGTWFFITAMIAAAVTGERGLTGGGSLTNRSIKYGYVIAALLSLGATIVLLIGLINAL